MGLLHWWPVTPGTCILHLLLFLGPFDSGPAVACPSPARIPGRVADRNNELFVEILRDETITRLYNLAKISDADGFLERTFLSPASLRASNLILSWMQDAGLRTWVDPMGSVHGRVESGNSSAEALLIGSHLDTVIDAGMYDGVLGIVSAISAVKALKISDKLKSLKRPIEIIAFSDEEGVRFQSTFLGSAAIAGTLPKSALHISDKSGRTVQDVLAQNSIMMTEESFIHLRYKPQSVWGYVEVHIEQGPILEGLGYALGVVDGIAGQTRLKITVRGTQGHAGTVPMYMRRDPMVAAAEIIILLEHICKHSENFTNYDGDCNGLSGGSSADSVVCTVGEILCWPGASNVIPQQVIFTADIRARDDMTRQSIMHAFSNGIYRICGHRSVSCVIEQKGLKRHHIDLLPCMYEVWILLLVNM